MPTVTPSEGIDSYTELGYSQRDNTIQVCQLILYYFLSALVDLPHYLLFHDVRRKIFGLRGIQWLLMLAIICHKHMRRGIKARVHNGSIPHKYVHISELITPSQPY
jgi:hypothetical protein